MNSCERLNRYEAKYGAHKQKLLDEPVLKEVINRGYTVIPDFWSAEQCDRAVKRINDILSSEHSPEKYIIWRDELDADKRIFGANNIAPDLDLFSDPKVQNWIHQLYNSDALSGFSMAGCIDFADNNLGSGQGWHRDSCITYQFKAILYLTDVNEENGPFQYRPNSAAIDDILYLEEKAGIDIDTNRLEEFDEFLSQEDIHELTGKRGTLVLADTRGVHRGKPIEQGSRYALTNYYWQNGIPEHILPFVNQ